MTAPRFGIWLRSRQFLARAAIAAVVLVLLTAVVVTALRDDSSPRPAIPTASAAATLNSLANRPAEPIWTFTYPEHGALQLGVVGADRDTALVAYASSPPGPPNAQLAVLDAATGHVRGTIALGSEAFLVRACAVAGASAACSISSRGDNHLVFIDLKAARVVAAPVSSAWQVAAVGSNFLAWSDRTPPTTYRADGTIVWAGAETDRVTVVPDAGLILSVTPSLRSDLPGEARVIRAADGQVLTSESVTSGTADPEFQGLTDGRFALRTAGATIGLYSADGDLTCNAAPGLALAQVRTQADADALDRVVSALPVPVAIRGTSDGTEVSAVDLVDCDTAWKVDLAAAQSDVWVSGASAAVVIASAADTGLALAVTAATGEAGKIPARTVLGSDGELFAVADAGGDGFSVYHPSRSPEIDGLRWDWISIPGHPQVFADGLYKGAARIR